MLVDRVTVLAALIVVLTAILGGPGSGRAQTRPMPPGHPPITEPRAAPGSPPSSSATDGLTWKPPAGWTEETPSSSMRRAQYRIPGPGGPGELVVFYFGPGQGGDAKANAARWAAQFHRPDGSPVGDAAKSREIKVGDIPVTLVEVAGTYVGGMGGGPSGPDKPNYMLLGAIAQGPDANWFFRATGPRATLEAQRATFDDLIRSIKRATH